MTQNASELPIRVVRYGKDEPLRERRLLRAGPLTAVLENGDLRYVSVGGQEVVRRVYVAVRDHRWDTIEPRITAFDVHQDDLAFVVRFTAEHCQGDVDFVWRGAIEGTSAGVITYAMDGEARAGFLKNRIGICVLHPMDLAGTPVQIETPNGSVGGAFPTRISAHQPFVDIVAIRHPTDDGGEVAIRFEGDLFEMEDQRNWTDASYKTYSTPLRLPYPVQMEPGQRVTQRVTLEIRSGVALDFAAPEADDRLHVGVGREAVGTLPPIGLALASHHLPLTALEVEHLRTLRLAHVRAHLDLGDAGWQERLRRVRGEAEALRAAMELEVLADDAGEDLSGLVAALESGDAPVDRLLVFPRSGLVTTAPVLLRARELMTQAGLSAAIGGGSRAYFTELNRASLPLDLMDVVSYTINPQVHASDNASLAENLTGQAATVESARAIAGDRPIAVGPVTLRPRFNPNASGDEPEPAPEELPMSVDSRQLSLFGAGWTLGSIRNLATAGAASLTYYETTGWRGVMERSANLTRRERFPSRPQMLFPLYHVLADVADFAGGELLPVTLSDPLAVEALALRERDRVRVLIASFVDEPRTVTVSLPRLAEGRLRHLDETTAEQAMTDGEGFRRRVDRDFEDGLATVALELRPFAVARLDGRIAPA